MKTSIVTGLVLLTCAFTPQISAGGCKPDVSREDRISKQRNEIWTQSLFETGLLTQALVSSSGIGLYATVGSYGSIYAINVELHKQEQSAGRALVESAYRAVKGDRFLFGIKDGEPLTFIATDVGNDTKVDMFGNINTTVVLSSQVGLKELAAMREALTTKAIDAVRINLVGGGTVEENVKDKFGEKLRDKFGCFYQSLDKKGIRFAPITTATNQVAPGTPRLPQGDAAIVAGRFIKRGHSSDFIELSNGQFSIVQGGMSLDGTYTVDGDVLTLMSPRLTVQPKGRLVGNTITDDNGVVWEKAPQLTPAISPSQPPQPTPTSTGGTVATQVAAFTPGKWTQRNSGNSIELKADGTFSLRQGGKEYGGYYKVQGDTMTTQFWNAPNQLKMAANIFRLRSESMMDSNDGVVWEKGKQTGPQKSFATQLTTDQVIQMVAAKLPDDIIITTIRNSASTFDLTPEVMIKMKAAGVSDAVIRVMTR